jgi:hypothetical protein
VSVVTLAGWRTPLCAIKASWKVISRAFRVMDGVGFSTRICRVSSPTKILFPEIRRQRDLIMLGDGGVWKMLCRACGCEQKKSANEESVSHILSDGNLAKR